MVLPRRHLFVAAIVVGSFLLFLIQPMVARLVLPKLGGAPNVWNSAMLVYQALLLGGYAYAHAIGRIAIKRQFMLHFSLFALAGLSLPIALVEWEGFAPGLEVLWVPILLFASIGPVFFVVSAQAPLVQRWYASAPDAGDPYPLYAGSNVGSFAGLLSYPLLVEPNLTLSQQAWMWTGGYILLGGLLLLLAFARWQATAPETEQANISEPREKLPLKTVLIWLALAAVPSGLMLSTTTHLTTDIFAMPLLWVMPLGLYLLSYVPAFAENRAVASAITRVAPFVVLLVGGLAMVTGSAGGFTIAFATLIMLFVIAVALHGKLYDLRPDPSRLTFFYLIMSAGGVLGGLFTALIAPVAFDWVWEHPILVLAAAALLPLGKHYGWQQRLENSSKWRLPFVLSVLLAAIGLATALAIYVPHGRDYLVLAIFVAMAFLAWSVKFHRFAFIMVLLLMMMGRGGGGHLGAYEDGDRVRSYFGVHTIKENTGRGVRTLTHGTTLHGIQFLDPDKSREPTSYYGRTTGVGLLLQSAAELYGENADVGIVGLGAGTLACYRTGEQNYRYYEIDPAILEFSSEGQFSYLSQCTPDAETVIGDARIALEQEAPAQYDVLVVDAFSSDTIPLHLLTREAFAIYNRALKPGGTLAIHISNRYLTLEPVVVSAARDCGCTMIVRRDFEVEDDSEQTASIWAVMSQDADAIERVKASSGSDLWNEPGEPLEEPWTDDYASILDLIQWNNVLGIAK
ncbi:Spermidine synthase [Altererythrobacter insulae]|nr:Spermidine synthase [Altererythrobacter insulae]